MVTLKKKKTLRDLIGSDSMLKVRLDITIYFLIYVDFMSCFIMAVSIQIVWAMNL